MSTSDLDLNVAPAAPPAPPAPRASSPPPRPRRTEAPSSPAAAPQPAAKPPAERKAPPLAAPPAAQPVDEAEDGSEPTEAAPGGALRWLRTTPSWLISAVMHLALLVALALVTISYDEDLRKGVLLAAAPTDVEEEFTLEDVVFDADITPVELDEITASAPTDIPDPGAADLASVAQDVLVMSEVGVAFSDTTTDTIGLLFGDDGKALADANTGAKGAEFFGIRASGRKFVFIVDSSRSMRNGLFEAACEELSYAVRRLNPDQYFYVIFFDHDAARMTFDGKKQPEPRAVPATSENIVKMERWMRTIELELRTDPYDAVEFAMSLLPDAMYILTDGKFTDGGKTERYLKKENLVLDPLDGARKPKVVVNTVGFYQRDGEPTLTELARLYGGTYRFVPKPPGKK